MYLFGGSQLSPPYRYILCASATQGKPGLCEEQAPEPKRANPDAMNLHRRLAALFVLLALAGCTQSVTARTSALRALFAR